MAASKLYDRVLEAGINGVSGERATKVSSPCDRGCIPNDELSGMSVTSGCGKRLGGNSCKYSGGSSLRPTRAVLRQIKIAAGMPELSDDFRDAMHSTADLVSPVVRQYCPKAAANMSVNPESVCRAYRL